jgi:hypothetical protein
MNNKIPMKQQKPTKVQEKKHPLVQQLTKSMQIPQPTTVSPKITNK